MWTCDQHRNPHAGPASLSRRLGTPVLSFSTVVGPVAGETILRCQDMPFFSCHQLLAHLFNITHYHAACVSQPYLAVATGECFVPKRCAASLAAGLQA